MFVAKYILQILKSQERGKTWLADKIGITKQVIHYKFSNNSFTADDLLKIADVKVLNINLEELKKEYQNNNNKLEE